jgi:antitoxin FitA
MATPVMLSEALMTRLRVAAASLHVAPEALLQQWLEERLAACEDDFTRAAAYVVTKNAELYRRLA